MFVPYVIIATCVVILLNIVPRINDMHGHVSWKDKRSIARFVGLCLTAVSALWLSFSIMTPSHSGQDYAIMVLLIGVAATWTTSPSISKSWIDYMFHSGEVTVSRRATDKK